jgi:hypothetical protein
MMDILSEMGSEIYMFQPGLDSTAKGLLMTLKIDANAIAQLGGGHERHNFGDDFRKQGNTDSVDFDFFGIHGVEVDHRVSKAHVSHP